MVARRTGGFGMFGGGVAAAYTIDNAALFISGAELSATYSITAPWTFSAWLKTDLATIENLILGATGGEIHFNSNATLEAEGTSSTALFRDHAAFYHIHVSDNGLYVNNVSHGSVTTTNLSNQKLFDDFLGYAAEVHLKSGTDAVTNFGETDNNGHWIPIAATSGEHYFTFSNSGDLGENSGSAGNWTATSVTQVQDTPTDSIEKSIANYATWDGTSVYNFTISNGNKTLEDGASTTIFLSQAMFTGKWYWEVKADSTPNNGTIGISGLGYNHRTYQGFLDGSASLFCPSANQWYIDGSNTTDYTHAAITSGDVVQFAYDADTGKFWVGINDTWINSGDPAAGTGELYTRAAPQVGHYCNGTSPTTDWTLQVADDELTYTPPTGFNTLSSANVTRNQTGVLSDVFVETLDTEANIVASVAAAHSFSTSVTFYKNRDAAEDWAWRFSHDASNEHAVDTTDVYQAVRSLSGSNEWIAFTINGDNTYNVDIGSQAHTNGGGDTTVTHNLGVDNAILLFPRAGGDVYMHHPVLTSGKLLKLNSTAAEAALTRIKTITSNAFAIESAAPTDTYDYIVLGESDFLKLYSFIGNGNSDGTFANTSGKPLTFIYRPHTEVYSPNIGYDAENEYNVVTHVMALNGTGTESTLTLWDFVSNGIKQRNTYAASNGSGKDIMCLTWVEPEPPDGPQLRAR